MVSIIVPVYNAQYTISRCVDSLLAQTYSDFELLLIDDGSTDKSGVICDSYANSDSRIRVQHTANNGVSKARNIGLDLAQGTYITFCDSDDVWGERLLETYLHAICTNNVDSVIGNYITYDNGQQTTASKIPGGLYGFCGYTDKMDYIVHLLLSYKHTWTVWNRMFRADIINENHIRFCENCNGFAEDMGFVLTYTFFTTTVYIIDSYENDTCYHYYITDGSIMSQSKDTPRINDINEVSFYVSQSYQKVFGHRLYHSTYPIIHYLIMNNQYTILTDKAEYAALYKLIFSIRKADWYRLNTKRLMWCYSKLKHLFFRRYALQAITLSMFCMNGNTGLYLFVSKALQKLIDWKYTTNA